MSYKILGKYLSDLNRDFIRYSESKLSQYDLTLNMWRCMMIIENNKSCNLRNIAKVLNVDSAIITRNIKKLEYFRGFKYYDEFKNYVREIIGYSYKMSEYVLYTPILRYVKNNIRDVKDSIKYILSNEDSIAYNILKVKNVDCEEIMKELESV